MRTLRGLSIKQKLLAIILVTAATALLLSGIAIIVSDWLLFRAGMQRDLAALASIIGDNSTAALAFDDPKVATQILGALKARPHMVAACMYRENGTPFAEYVRAGDSAACGQPVADAEVKFTERGLRASHPILLDNRRIGTLVLLYDTGEATERIRLYGGIVLTILLASSLIASLLSSLLGDIIAAPISRLADAARSVSQSGDYSIRVEKDADDEVGILVDAFNEMVNRIPQEAIDYAVKRSGLG